MFRSFIFIVIVLATTVTFAQTINKTALDQRGNKKLLGLIDKQGLTQPPFNVWFSKNYESYLTNDKEVAKLKNALKGYKITVFLGTWCGDSKREVPRFYKVLDAAGFPEKHLKIIGVDNDRASYKQSPGGEEKGLNIHRVPTFIFYKNGKEVNRIVETPRETFEKDILKITTGETYKPNYMAVNYLNTLFKTKTLHELESMQGDLVPQVSQVVKGVSELNTYGFVLLRSNRAQKAFFTLNLNAKIFPYHFYVYSSLGNAYLESENRTDALKNYKKSLALNSENTRVKSKIQEIEGIK